MKNDTGRRRTGLPLDLGVAALAAAAFGFVAFAMPADLFASLVVQSRLPEFVTAAQPPLGTTARGAAAAAAALAGFAAIFVLLRALDRLPSRPPRKADVAADPGAPRVRRADAHPDAPSRRPLLAGRELSEPVEPFESEPEPAQEMFADLPAQPLPGFLVPDEAEHFESEFQAEPEAEAEDETEGDAFILDQRADESSFDTLVAQLPDWPEEAGDESITDLMRRLESGLSRREQAAEDADAAFAAADEISEAPEAPATPSWLAPQPQEADAEAAPAPVEPVVAQAVAAQPPVDEFGELRWPPRMEVETVVPPPPVADAGPAEEPDDQYLPAEPRPEGPVHVGHRLRSAIDEMQKIAARGG